MNSEGAALGRLAELRRAIVAYQIDHDGDFPAALSELTPKYVSQIPPALWHSPYHPKTNVVENPTWIDLEADHLSDTGGCAYINDPGDPDWGSLAIDCTHPRVNGNSWNDYLGGDVPTLRSMSAADRNNLAALLGALDKEDPRFKWKVILLLFSFIVLINVV